MATRWEVTSAVREKSDLAPPARLVMLVLADLSENETAIVPASRTLSLSELAKQTGLGRSTVVEHLDKLETLGWIKRDQPSPQAARAGAKTKYRLRVGGSPGAGLVQELDYPNLVQELDGGSPGAGRKRKNSSKSSSKPLPTGARAPRRTATRIPDDFTVTEEMIAWARKNTPLVGMAETEAFIDYFRAAPGAKGLKLDWIATWRNWMRTEQKRARPRTFQQPASNAPTVIPPAEKCPEHPSFRIGACPPCKSELKARKAS